MIRRALGLAYGPAHMQQKEVAKILGISAPVISGWKKKYLEGGLMEIPEIDPKDYHQLSDEEIKAMSDKELADYIHQLELKAAVLEGTVKVLKAEGIEDLSNDELAAIVDAVSDKFTVTEALKSVGLASSSYYYCKSKAVMPDKYLNARQAIKEEFDLVKGSRGYRYIRQRLRQRAQPIVLSGKTVRRLMAEEGCLVSYAKKKRRYSSYQGEISQAPANLVARRFWAAKPNELWLTDITEFSINAGKVYLSAIIDCFDGAPVSWSLSTKPNARLANNSLAKACKTLNPLEKPILHSDRGCHYRWPGWIKCCERYGITRSMSAKGCSPDNAAMEGFFGRLKNEFFYYQDWSQTTLEEFIDRLDCYIHYYCFWRPKESLNWLSPYQYRLSLGIAA